MKRLSLNCILSPQIPRLRSLNPLHLLRAMHRFPQIHAALDIELEIGAIAEYPRQDQRGRGGDAAAVVAQVVHMLAQHAHCPGKRALGQVHGFHKILGQYFADIDGFAFSEGHVDTVPHW